MAGIEVRKSAAGRGEEGSRVDRLRRLSRRFAFVAGIAFVGKIGFAPPPLVRVWEVRVEADAYCERGQVRPPLSLSLVTRIPSQPSSGAGLAVAAPSEDFIESFEEVRVDLTGTDWLPIWSRGRDLWLVPRETLRSKKIGASLVEAGVPLGRVNWKRLRCAVDGQPVHVSLPLWMNPEGSTYAEREWTRRCRWDRDSQSSEGVWRRLSRDALVFRGQKGEIRLEGDGAQPAGTGWFSCML